MVPSISTMYIFRTYMHQYASYVYRMLIDFVEDTFLVNLV